MLITQRQEESAQVEADTAKRAIFWQRFIWALRDGREEKSCEAARSVLEEAQKSNVFALAAVMEAAPGLAIADWVNRARACGLEEAMSSGLPPIGKLKGGGGMQHIPPAKNQEAAKKAGTHTQPVVPAGYKSKFLEENEAKGGHVLDRHVGKTDEQLVHRLWTDRPDSVSTFTNEAIAEAVIKETLAKNAKEIRDWLNNPGTQNLKLDYTGNAALGRGISEGELLVSNKTNATIILKKDSQKGFYVITAYTR